jgi:two-component system sensor histidine kinase MprB
MSLRWRLALILAAVAAASIALASSAAYLSADRELQTNADRSLRTYVRQFDRPGGRPGPPPQRSTQDVVQIIDADGEVRVADAGPTLPVDSIDEEIAAGDRRGVIRDVTIDGEPYRMITASTGTGAIQVARDLSEINDALEGLRRRLLVIGLVGTAGAALLGWLVAWRFTRPITQLTVATEQFASTRQIAEPIDVQRHDEVGRLATSFNDMLAALQTSRRQQQQLVMDASHELRTPLTTLRANIDLLARARDLPDDERRVVIETATVELDELSSLVAELVDLATEQAPDELGREAVDLGALVEVAVERARRRTGRVVEVRLDGPATISGVPTRLTRAVSNLLDNADKFSPAGLPTSVEVVGTTVTVADRGPGIAPADRARVFDRFYRADTARTLPGSGLGLAIVHQVVTEHGGTVSVDDNPGGGTRLTLQFPPTRP